MSLSGFFVRLGAPLHNVRWSWGAVRDDSVVFLRVWQDEVQKLGDLTYVRLTKHQVFEDDQDNPGYQERMRHIELVENGAPCYLVFCIAKEIKLPPRKVKDFISDAVFATGRLVEFDGDSWIEKGRRIPVQEIAPR